MTIEERLKLILSANLNKITEFDGFKKYDGVEDSEDFQAMMREDPAFAPFSLDREKYVVARIGGNLVTSIHRKLGDLYEDILLELLIYRFGFSKEYLKFSLKIVIDGIEQVRTTDGRLVIDEIEDSTLREKVSSLVEDPYIGLGIEIRSCYQIGDSKRIQADDHMATALKAIDIEPKMLVMCTTSLVQPVRRLAKNWTLYEGSDSFTFISDLTDFALFDFLMDNRDFIRSQMDEVFDML
ncbi:MAG: type I restriction endonuclease [Acidobacteria bacterium]|nr:MAG: type I restriction endonuclease [Acidobacteriota bacterium]REK02339.1 MAG: type I restriction endonuclease [Acidobacteriota bacterium]REK13859.1 MAG: type I restriction endonuclease [Acidobacteriota bacterium]REK41854.1 MAG: type I restriction endonuclease [Acidobacteriota bacterium]